MLTKETDQPDIHSLPADQAAFHPGAGQSVQLEVDLQSLLVLFEWGGQ